MEYGIGIGGPMAMIGPMAQMVENAGFESCWAAETTNSAFVTAQIAIQATNKIKVGTAIALAFPRSPTITAMEAMDLDELSGGRFIVGLGTQVKRVNQDRFSVPFEHPAPKLKEYAQAMRTVFRANRGEDVTFEGRFYTIKMPVFGSLRQPQREVPIYFAAVNKLLARYCGEVADGLLGHPLASPLYLQEVIKPAIAEGAEKAGRKPEECNLTASPLITISDDIDLARRELKLQIAFYSTTRTYTPILEMHGKADIVPALREAHGNKDKETMISLIDDDLCDAIGVAARTKEEAREGVKRWDGIADRLLVSGPWYGPKPERMMENYQALVETFGSN